MSDFVASDFSDYHAYETHRNQLERARRVSKRLLDLWADAGVWFPKGSSVYYEMLSLVEDATKIGYEAALGMPHRAKDYDVDSATLRGYAHKCDFCKHQYFVYNCEEECARKNKGLPCEIDTVEYI